MSRTLYPKIAENEHFWLPVENDHQIYVEHSGNVNGIPVVYLHGGPGGGCSSNHRRYFDPEKYHIILFDQRGSGRSRPSPSIQDNTTAELVKDIELIREHFGYDKWLVCGGSWGTTLALTYGIQYSDRVTGFILRGVFLGSIAENNWLYESDGAAHFFPDAYQDFLKPISDSSSSSPLIAYTELLQSANEVAAISASKAWYLWELRISSLEHTHIGSSYIEDSHQAWCMALITTHYLSNNCFLPDRYIIDNINRISHIPAIILHGRYDMVCRVSVAHHLADIWENATLQILPKAGHGGFESQTIDAFCKATDLMAEFLQNDIK